MWNLSVPDWQDRIRQRRSLMPDLPLFQREANDALAFFEMLRLPDVPLQPHMKEACGPWFKEIVRTLFGSRDPDTNVRHVREIFALVGKGNSKTSYGAGLMVTALLMNSRPRAEFMFVGPTQAIADLAYSQAVGMIEADPELKKRFQVRDHVKEIRDRLRGAKLKIKTFDLDILTGPKPVGVLLDELHLLGKNANTAKVLRQLRGGLEKNTEGFMLIISTQSDEPPRGAFKDELMMARSIRDGRFDGRMLPIIYEFPPEMAKNQEIWENPENWHLVMPNLGRSLQLSSLAHDWEAEKTKGEHAIRVWASQHLNIEIGLALQSDRWVGADYWERQARKITLQDILRKSDVVTIGIDGGGLDDLLGLSVVGRDTHSREWMSWSKAWAHQSVLQRRKGEASRLADFNTLGELVVVEKLGQDIDDVVSICAEVFETGKLDKVGLDPVGIGAIVDALAEEGIEGDQVVGISQGWKMSGAIKTTERKLADGTLTHADQRLMDWCVGNARVEPRGNAITITKQTAGSAKIDPLMALFNGVALMAQNPSAAGGRIDDFLKSPIAA